MANRSLLKGRNILLVEDEMMVAMLLEAVLENEGCNVMSVGHLEQAMRLATERAIDAAILDVNLNGHRSYPVADVLVARAIPFVFASGYVDDDPMTLYPTRPVLTKPYKPDYLIATLKDLIATASGHGS